MATEQLIDQVAIITGGASGIGQRTAQYLASNGVRVAVLDNRRPVSSDCSELLFICCDVANEDEVNTAVTAVATRWKRIDFLIICAGVLDSFAAVGNTSTQDWKRCFNVNVDGAMFCMRACIQHFLAQETRGRIVSLCSTASIRGAACGTAYTASKHALLGLSRSTAWMYAKEGVICNVLLLGPTKGTRILDNTVKPDKFGFERIETFGSLLPKPLNVDDIIPSLLYLLTAPGVNGAELALDHGLTTA